MDNFKCQIDVEPVEEWLKTGKGCPPCLMAPLASYYLGALEKAGEKELAADLKKTFEAGDTLTIGKKLDTIKTDVGEALLKQLRDLDCFAQTFEQDAASK